MKTMIRSFGKGYAVMAMVLVAFFLVSCGGGQNRQAKEQLEETKNQTVMNINKIKNDIEERISYVNKEMEEASDETREELEEARENLKKQKELLESETEKVRAASLDTWNEVVASASQTITQARRETSEVSRKVREMLDAQEEE